MRFIDSGASLSAAEKHGRFNCPVVGSLVLTSLGALLPIAAEYARRERMRGLKWAAWLAIPLALAFVFTVSIQRTGSASDIDEASRQQLAAAIAIAEKEQGEAEKQLVVDQLMVANYTLIRLLRSSAATGADVPPGHPVNLSYGLYYASPTRSPDHVGTCRVPASSSGEACSTGQSGPKGAQGPTEGRAEES